MRTWWERNKFSFLGVAIVQPFSLSLLGFTWSYLSFGLLLPIVLLVAIDLIVCISI